MSKNYIIFDGDCLFCNQVAIFLAKKDVNHRFLFTSNTSEVGRAILKDFNLLSQIDKTVVVKVGDSCYTKSKAVYHFFKESDTFPLLRFTLKVTPQLLSDFFYDIIAKHRKKIISSKNCPIPDVTIAKKFV